MAKKYTGLSLAQNSRFVAYFDKLSEAQKEELGKRIDCYIKENQEYCDKGNYQHLCNIFTSMALYHVLLSSGMEGEKAEEEVFSTMYAYMQKQREAFQKLAKKGWFWPLIKKLVPIGFKKGSGYGWSYAWHKESPKNEFQFECTSCIYKPLFQKYGLERFGPKFCYNDIIVYGELPRTDFIRTTTISRGGDKCDFKFVRYKKGEEFERTKSV